MPMDGMSGYHKTQRLIEGKKVFLEAGRSYKRRKARRFDRRSGIL
jgi:hypothetical protein